MKRLKSTKLRGALCTLLLVSLVLSVGQTENAFAVPPCSEACDNTLAADLAICAKDPYQLGEWLCRQGAYVHYGGCMVGCGIGSLFSYIVAAPVWALPVCDIVPLEFGRNDTLGNILEGQGTVTDVELYALAIADIDTTLDIGAMAFQYLGDATFNGGTNLWEYEWDMNTFDSPGGYIVRAIFFDPAIPDEGWTSGCVVVMEIPRVPALTEWGLLVLLAILLGTGIWVTMRRRRRVSACI